MSFISNHLNGDPNKILQLINSEIKAISNFIEKYPNFKKLTSKEQLDIISNILNNNNTENQIIKLENIKRNSSKLMSLNAPFTKLNYADDCLYQLNMAMRECEFNFNLQMASAITVGILAVVTTAGIGSVVAEITMQVAITAIVVSYDHCLNTAGYQLDHCASIS
ncbi:MULTISPECIES: hypothetical protein [unclassified Pedobacter]|uniref:hypothetical protein n=1 Tax=unclassified Pedobacter TaxID=2628915 RepID=UPI001E54AA22|nr:MULTISPECIES: hypothetical protein [unclassified Pedobacter]